jgi:hypothetical protein
MNDDCVGVGSGEGHGSETLQRRRFACPCPKSVLPQSASVPKSGVTGDRCALRDFIEGL